MEKSKLDEMRERIQYLEFLDEVKWFQEHYGLNFEEAKKKVIEMYNLKN